MPFGFTRYKETQDDQLFGNWWGKKFGLAPSPSISSRRPQKIVGTDPQKYSLDVIVKECQSSGTLWEDPEFSATNESIFFSRSPPKPFQWKRPSEIVSDPQFFTGGVSRFDVQQGDLGDCWLLAAVANLTLYPELFHKVVPEQSFSKNYCGVFHFRFWQYGHWIDVVVDDRLPTLNGRLVFMHSTEKNEFWSALMEKAYAKLHGSYEALKGGSTSEAMEDFTGGLSEMFDLKEDPPKNLFRIMSKAMERCSLMGCSLEGNASCIEQQLPNGLVRGHAYSVTAVKQVNITLPNKKSGQIQLIRIRNPWGNECEWKGAWSDSSPEWQCITATDRKAMGLTFDADGEFWMSFPDFTKNFEKLEICNLGPEAAEAVQGNKAGKHWENQGFEGAWVKGATAGGCRNNLESFSCNPQYKVKLVDPDEMDEDDKCTCIIALLQKHRRKLKRQGISELLTVGYALYYVENTNLLNEPLDKEFFRTHVSCARSPNFINLREVCSRFRLPAGNYVIVPSTFDKNDEGEFMLRVFSEKTSNMTEVEEKTAYNPVETPGSDSAPSDDGYAHSAKYGTAPHKPVTVPNDPLDDASSKLSQFFEKIAGQDREMDAWELQKVLTFALQKEFKFDEFSLDTCRSMIACVDLSRSGKLELEEFKELWQSVRVWKTIFKKHDRDKSGSINAFELKAALKEAGYRLHSRVLTALVLRYASKDGQIGFDDFIGCAVKLKTMMEVFSERDLRQSGSINIDMDAWIELSMYA